mgnify:CR=1 FL=1
MKKYKRIFTIVIDSFGAGEMPDAAQYGDEGTDTMGHISQNVDEFTIPSEAWNCKSSSVETGCSSGATNGLLYIFKRSQYRKRYYDRTLGNDGASHHKTV